MFVEVFVLVLILVGRICRLVGPLSYVAQGTLMGLILGYPLLEVAWGDSSVEAFHVLVVAIVEGRPCLIFQ